MALGTFRPGQYTVQYGGASVGMCRMAGQSLRYRLKGKIVNDTDTYGQTPIEFIHQGGECFISMTMLEWTAGGRAAISPASTTFDGLIGVIGRLGSATNAALVLTALAGTPAAANGPASLTATEAILAPENDVEILFRPDETPMPVVFQLLAYDTGGGAIGFFTLT